MAKKFTVNQWLDAVEHVESRGDLDAVGDGGKSIGPMQISLAYWKDARMTLGVYENCRGPMSHFYSRLVVLAYMLRYCPKDLAAGDWEVCSRIHNGGPRGAVKKATVKYAWDVNKAMQEKKL